MDYLDDDAARPAVPGDPGTEIAGDLELVDDLVVDAAADVDPFLAELLPEDRNARRRVVTALLRAVLAERKIT